MRAHRPAGHWLIIKWNGAASRVLPKPIMRWHAHLLDFQRTKIISKFLSNVCGWFGIKLRFYECEYSNVFACGHTISVQFEWWLRELLPPADSNFRWNFVSIYSGMDGTHCIAMWRETHNKQHASARQLDSCDTRSHTTYVIRSPNQSDHRPVYQQLFSWV